METDQSQQSSPVTDTQSEQLLQDCQPHGNIFPSTLDQMDPSTSRTDPNASEVAQTSPPLMLSADATDSRVHSDRDLAATHTETHSPPANKETPVNPDLNTIFAYLQQMTLKIDDKFNETNDKLNEKLNETKSEINEKLNEKLNETKSEIKACSAMLQTQIQEIRETQIKFRQEINDLKSAQLAAQLEHSKDMAHFQQNVTYQIENSHREMKEFVDTSITEHKTVIESEIAKQQTCILGTVTAKIEQNELKIEQNLKTLISQTKTDSEQIATICTQTLRHELEPIIHNNNSIIKEQQTKLQTISDTLNKCETEMQLLKTNNRNPNSIGGPIQVICTGGDTNERQLPRYNGRSGNPNEYLRRLKRYYDKCLERQMNVDPVECLKDILEISFEGPASRWLQLIKADLTSWENFAEEFTNKYWSREVQRGVINKIEAEKYRNNGTLSRTEYFTERVLLLQSITPPMTEEEIVILLAERFDPLIQDSRSVQNITTVRAFERLLQREDIRDGPKRAKQNSNQSPNSQSRPNSPNHSNNFQSHNQNINPRAYQPKVHYSGQSPYRNNSSHDNNNHHQYNQSSYRYNHNNNRPRHEYRPYNQEQRQNRPTFYQRNERPYPTNEQSQVCAMIRQENSNPHNPSTNPVANNSNRSPQRQGNDSAL